MSEKSRPPKQADGSYDTEAIKAMFMASPYLDWYRFAEEQGWDPLAVRNRLPVRTWIKEKRDHLAEKQMEILTGIFHERKFKWTHDIVKTLEDYPAAIDLGLNIAKAKMGQWVEMYKDYQDYLKKPERQTYRNRNNLKVRVPHPFEKLSFFEISMMTKGIKELTEAKLKALMLDKWAISKFDLPVEADLPEEQTAGSSLGPKFTIEGMEVVDGIEFQKWMDRYMDKPQEPYSPDTKPAQVTQDVTQALVKHGDGDGTS